MAVVHSAAVGTGASQGLYLEMVAEGHGQGLGQLLSCTGPASPALGAFIQTLRCAPGRPCKPSEGLFEWYRIPSSYVFLMLEGKRGCVPPCANCLALPCLPDALAVFVRKQQSCGGAPRLPSGFGSCSWNKLNFLVAQWHSFQEMFTRPPLCLVSQ